MNWKTVHVFILTKQNDWFSLWQLMKYKCDCKFLARLKSDNKHVNICIWSGVVLTLEWDLVIKIKSTQQTSMFTMYVCSVHRVERWVKMMKKGEKWYWAKLKWMKCASSIKEPITSVVVTVTGTIKKSIYSYIVLLTFRFLLSHISYALL